MPNIKKLCNRLSYDDFLSIEGPTGVSVGPEGTKSSFFHHLGLSEHNNRHLGLYERMRHEATQGMDQLFASRDCLQPDLAHDERVQPPYTSAQMTEVAFQRQIDKIYASASRQTRGIYDIVRTPDGQNWVIRWMLWRAVQEARRKGKRARSSSPEAEASTLSVCTTVSDLASITTPLGRSPFATPTFASIDSPTHSGQEPDWREPVRKVVKQDPDVAEVRARGRTKEYWEHVMNI